MSVASEIIHLGEPDDERSFRLRTFVIVSAMLHVVIFTYYLLFGGIFGVEGPGGGEALTFQLAAGQGNDLTAAADLEGALDQPTFADADVEPAPEPEVEPEPKPEPVAVPVRKSESTTTETSQKKDDADQAQSGGADGTVGANARGGGGEAEVTIVNKKGDSLTAGQIRGMASGRTLNLEMGRLDISGGNRQTNVLIKLNTDGTSDVELTNYYFRTFHSETSSTSSRSSSGKWWIEGNLFCHQSRIIANGTKDCYHMTMEGSVLRLYYDRCKLGSSNLCKTGRISAEGGIE